MIIDEEPRSFAVAIFGKASEMKFVDMLHGKGVDVSGGVEPVINRGNMDVVDVEQKPASGLLGDCRQEFASVILVAPKATYVDGCSSSIFMPRLSWTWSTCAQTWASEISL